MYIVYDSKTGNVRRFVQKLTMKSAQIDEALTLEKPFVLVTYTTGYGEVPMNVLQFLRRNHRHLQGVAASGNKNWGQNYARSADVISQLYRVPILCKFELSGTAHDVRTFQERVNQLAAY
ncbi:class Ib ribonucleoside-diphosphate reductase assembly flavoprotein NrdI [Brevibacillus humidisoli]|uniref:class Ib ribonucleoside-diphosphate reductase assembly flavoprotein NrdI n=1 Tax=Brevibacillus humidisoli TaxID=2895522 RepID=UPI001E5B569D|nr:class Ib ribonucleoside-diphosphate reductase assembly flavoprotein NrdI [Brevibacillus humidisoli]UFJ40757.1 class Ib ribonucleoside-diphosphate reductase assembly flavoprotein NrdI [Brevibacillus humidisoli]